MEPEKLKKPQQDFSGKINCQFSEVVKCQMLYRKMVVLAIGLIQACEL